MEITKVNEHGVLIKGKQASIAIDPLNENFELQLEGKTADIILASKAFLEVENPPQDAKVFSWPGEYEVKGVSISAYIEYPEEKDEDRKFLVFSFIVDGLRICYLKDLSAELHSDLIEKLGDVDLLILPTSDKDKVVNNTLEEIGPNGILPITFPADQVQADAFFQKQSLTAPEKQDRIVINSRADFKSDKLDIFLLH